MPMIDEWVWNADGTTQKGGNCSTGRRPCTSAICPPQILLHLARDWFTACELAIRGETAWAVAWPWRLMIERMRQCVVFAEDLTPVLSYSSSPKVICKEGCLARHWVHSVGTKLRDTHTVHITHVHIYLTLSVFKILVEEVADRIMMGRNVSRGIFLFMERKASDVHLSFSRGSICVHKRHTKCCSIHK
jgi:hypothetical protein